jgi:hypothetical protein
VTLKPNQRALVNCFQDYNLKDPKDSGNEAADEGRQGGNEVVDAVQELGGDPNTAHVDHMVEDRILN